MSTGEHAPAPAPAMIVFDVDGTLVEHDDGLVIWQILNRHYGTGSVVDGQRYKAFMAGALSYAEWVRLDIEEWIAGGATLAGIQDVIRAQLRLVPHAFAVIEELRQRGYVLAIVSGTLDVVIHTLLPAHGIEHVFANRIWFTAAGHIDGFQATPYDMEGKAEALRVLAQRTGIPLSQFVFVGDNLNDCSALQVVGHPVAYDPKHPRPRELARHVIPGGQMRNLLDLVPLRASPVAAAQVAG